MMMMMLWKHIGCTVLQVVVHQLTPILFGFNPEGFLLKIAVNKVALEQVLYDSLTPFLSSFHHYFILIYPLPYQVCDNT
jgi:hypothetical protein